jgi:hypothetical protein
MFFSGDDVSRLLEAFRRDDDCRKRRNRVGGAEDDRHDNRHRRNRFEDVAGIFDENFRVRVNAHIDEDFLPCCPPLFNP